MTNFERITIIANQLANAGKKPTIALIKAKLPNPVPLPQIIGALKSWHHEPENCVFPEVKTIEGSGESKVEEKIKSEDNALTLEQVNALINSALSPVKEELAEVKKQLQQLKQANS